MITYQTILGQQISLGQLPLDDQSTILRVLALAEVYTGDALEFASRCRRLFRRSFVRDSSYQAAMRSPVGCVYRDCFYRIHANNVNGQRPEELLESIRYNPLRLLFDRFLDGNWRYQNDFAESAGLNSAQVARIFKNVLGGKCSGEISMQKLGKALRALDIVPTLADARERSGNDFVSAPSAPTGREWYLILTISWVTKHLYQPVDKEAFVNHVRACRDTLAQYLSFIFGVRDYNHLTDFTHRVLRELLTTIRSSPELTKGEVLSAVINPDETSFKAEASRSEWVGFITKRMNLIQFYFVPTRTLQKRRKGPSKAFPNQNGLRELEMPGQKLGFVWLGGHLRR